MGAKSKFLQILTLDTYYDEASGWYIPNIYQPFVSLLYGLMDLSWQLHKVMTIVCRSYVIGHKFINPTYECWVKWHPDINPKFG